MDTKMKNPYAMCRLDNGSIIQYHAAAILSGGHTYDSLVFRYIGVGHIYSIKGCTYTGGPKLSFFKLRDNRPRWAR